jgi:hypothetical protein
MCELFFNGDDTIVGFSAAARLDFDCFCINVHGNYWTYRFTKRPDGHPVHGGWTIFFNLSPFCWWRVGHFNILRKKNLSFPCVASISSPLVCTFSFAYGAQFVSCFHYFFPYPYLTLHVGAERGGSL